MIYDCAAPSEPEDSYMICDCIYLFYIYLLRV